MKINFYMALFSFPLVCSQAFAQDALPPKLEGRWFNPGSGHSNKIEIEVLKMESPTSAVINIAFWPYCRTSESVAEFKEGTWTFTAKRCNTPGATEIVMKVRPVEGKNRLEGNYGSGSERTVYLEWK